MGHRVVVSLKNEVMNAYVLAALRQLLLLRFVIASMRIWWYGMIWYVWYTTHSTVSIQAA